MRVHALARFEHLSRLVADPVHDLDLSRGTVNGLPLPKRLLRRVRQLLLRYAPHELMIIHNERSAINVVGPRYRWLDARDYERLMNLFQKEKLPTVSNFYPRSGSFIIQGSLLRYRGLHLFVEVVNVQDGRSKFTVKEVLGRRDEKPIELHRHYEMPHVASLAYTYYPAVKRAIARAKRRRKKFLRRRELIEVLSL